MRITGGELGGRHVKVPPGRLRPTQDRVREAIFSALAARVPEARVLDLFAGSGAFGLEAWSRGAAEVWWVEKEACTCRHLKANVEALCRDAERKTVVCCQDTFRFLMRSAGHCSFDLVFADPPYAEHEHTSLLPRLLEALVASERIVPDGVLVFEQSRRLPPVEAEGWTLAGDRTYGETRVLWYRLAPSSS